MDNIAAPYQSEYHKFYQTYVDHSYSKDVSTYYEQQRTEFIQFLRSIPKDRHNYSYAPGKWTLKGLLRHIIDAERIFSYRAMAIARGDQASLPGMDQDDYMKVADDSGNSFADLVQEFDLLRQSNILMFKNFSKDAFLRTGTASDAKVSVRALLYIIIGHLEHHITIISERYIEHV